MGTGTGGGVEDISSLEKQLHEKVRQRGHGAQNDGTTLKKLFK